MSKVPRTTPRRPKPDPLQELYFYADHTDRGNTYLAWYGQSRAKGESHEAALLGVIEHFRFEAYDWFQKRLTRFDPDEAYSIANSNIRTIEELHEATK